MAKTQKEEFEDPIRRIGADSTATFDNSSSNPTEHASSEVLDEALDEGTAVEDEEVDVDVELEDDDEDEDDEDEDDDEDDEDEESPVMVM